MDLETMESTSKGAAWVDRFLAPLLSRNFSNARALECLQVAADDDTEAVRLRELGHRCEMTEPGPDHTLRFPDASYDFVFTGRFTLRASDRESRATLAREFFRVLREGGAVLLLVGNRWCPLDLSRNGPLLHSPWSRACLAYRECTELFVREAGFRAATPISMHRHFGWASLTAFLRPLGNLLDAHWRYVATPSRKWLYSSPLNPTFLLWLNK
jgi:SAM-dependent methyltransferase